MRPKLIVEAVLLAFLIGMLVGLGLCSSAHGEDLADAPSALGNRQPKPFHQVFDRWFLAEHGAMWLSAVADAEVTHEGIGRGVCLEGNSSLPLRPTRGQLYRSDLAALGFITGFDIIIQRFRVPGAKWIQLGLTSYDTQVHVRGAASWLGRCW